MSAQDSVAVLRGLLDSVPTYSLALTRDERAALEAAIASLQAAPGAAAVGDAELLRDARELLASARHNAYATGYKPTDRHDAVLARIDAALAATPAVSVGDAMVERAINARSIYIQNRQAAGKKNPAKGAMRVALEAALTPAEAK